jgi:hypothetical protein
MLAREAAAANRIVKFFKQLPRCFLSRHVVPAGRRFYTSRDVCCDIGKLVCHCVRQACADEHDMATPTCPKHKESILKTSALLVLCLRTTLRDERQHVMDRLNHLSSCADNGPVAAFQELQHLICVVQHPVPSILFFRLGYEAIKAL